jgi:hypothetical protein
MNGLIKNSHTRWGKYSKRKVRLPNATTQGYGRYEAVAGNLVSFHYPNKDETPGHPRLARVIGRVDAPREGEHCPAVKGWLAILELSESGAYGYLRWIDPAWVTECREVPMNFAAFFFSKEMPSLKTIMRLDDLGALSESYIGKYAECCEPCIQEHGLFADQKCVHKKGS